MADTKTSALSTITGAGTATGDKFLLLDVSDTTQGAGGTLKAMTRAELAAALSAEGLGASSVAIISDTKTSGTHGGSATSGSWMTRDLQTEDYDPDGIVSIASNQFTLGAGTYHIVASAPAYSVSNHKIRLQNITDTTTDLVGTSAQTITSNFVQTRSEIDGVITIAGSKTFEIQHQVGASEATLGLGVASSFGVNEVYTRVRITKSA